MKVRTRIAPSPTGFVHLGTIYQVLFDKAYAVKHNGQFIFRSEDTDRERFVEGAEEATLEAFQWFGLEPDEGVGVGGDFGPYRQSERLDTYHKYVQQLIDQGDAYYCFCSKERLTQVREAAQKAKQIPMYDGRCRNMDIGEAKAKVDAGESHVVRMKISKDQTIVVDEVVRGKIEFDSNVIDDQIILKADGYPTYHLAVVVDDHLMEISHIIRAQEWISSAPKHKVLYDMFGWEMPTLIHTPAIINMHNGKKLSKRDGHSSVDWYRRKGFLPKAILNFIALLGWSHPEEKEFFTFDEFVKVFELKDLSAASPRFDLTKLEWMNGEYIRKLGSEDLLDEIKQWLKYCSTSVYRGATSYETHWQTDDYQLLLDFLKSMDKEKQLLWVEINKERIKKYEDILPMNEFFIREQPLDKSLLIGKKSANEIKGHLEWVIDLLEDSDWSLGDIKDKEKKIVARAKEIDWKVGEVFTPIRIAIARNTISPPLFESMYLLGKESVIKSLNQAIDILG